MSHSIRRLPRSKALELARRPVRRFKPCCERLILLIAITLAYTRLRVEIGNWQALVAAAGAPLAVIDGPWSGRFVARRIRQRLQGSLGGRSRRLPDTERPPALWVPPTPYEYGIFISAGGPVAVEALQDDRARPIAASTLLSTPDRDPDLASGGEILASVPPIGRSQHCVLFAVDIAQFTGDGRDDEVQLALRDALYRLLIESFEGSGIPWRSCIHEDRGDGAVVVIPAHMPTITVIDPLVEQIRMRLRRHNRLSSPVAQVRLRLAVHIGEVYRDRHGLAGKAVNHLFRMLDASDLRQALLSSETGLALIVSDYVYQSVIHGGPGNADPAAYSEVIVRVKHFEAHAWLLVEPGPE
jgi:hypothetical protein